MVSIATQLWRGVSQGRSVGLLFAALVGIGATALAQERPVRESRVLRGTLSFDGRATAGNFVGTTDSVSGQMRGGDLGSVTGWVEARVKTLVTGNDRRDRDLNKSMESDEHPVIRFDLQSVRPQWERGDSAGVLLVGSLGVHGVTLPREIEAVLAWDVEGIRVRASFPMDLRDHKIGGLSKAFGLLKMYPDIDVHVDLFFASSGVPDSTGTDAVPRSDP